MNTHEEVYGVAVNRKTRHTLQITDDHSVELSGEELACMIFALFWTATRRGFPMPDKLERANALIDKLTEGY